MDDSKCTIPLGEIQARLAKMQKSLIEKEIDGAMIVQKTYLFYFSGTGQQG